MQPSSSGITPSYPQDYDFIVNPNKPQGPSLLGGQQSMRDRLLLVGGLVLVLILVFTVISKLFFGGSPAVPALTAVLQEQQELIHLTATTSSVQGVNPQNASFAITTQLSIVSAQQELKAYFVANHFKVDQKVLVLRQSKSIDLQLANAASTSTYNPVFKETMQAQLNTYQKLLKQAYSVSTGAKARQILSKDFDSSDLLLKQLNKD